MSFQQGLNQRRRDVTGWPVQPIPAIYKGEQAVAVIGFSGDRLAVFVDGDGAFGAAGFHQLEYIGDVAAEAIAQAQRALDARARER